MNTQKFFSFLAVSAAMFLLSVNIVSATPKFSPKPTAKPLEVNSYELFWPIVAGKVEGDSLYSLKLLKEKIRGFLIFSNTKKAEYNAVLSEKRLLEFENLAIEKKDFANASKTMDLLKTTQNKISNEIASAKNEGLDVSFTSQTVMDVFDKESQLLQSILSKIDQSQKSMVEDDLANLATISSKLK